jgi:hypothetical protein
MAGDEKERFRKGDHGHGPWVRSRVRPQQGFTRASDRNHGLYIPIEEMTAGEAAKVERFLDDVNTEPVVMALCFFSNGEENGSAPLMAQAAANAHAADAEKHAGE